MTDISKHATGNLDPPSLTHVCRCAWLGTANPENLRETVFLLVSTQTPHCGNLWARKSWRSPSAKRWRRGRSPKIGGLGGNTTQNQVGPPRVKLEWGISARLYLEEKKSHSCSSPNFAWKEACSRKIPTRKLKNPGSRIYNNRKKKKKKTVLSSATYFVPLIRKLSKLISLGILFSKILTSPTPTPTSTHAHAHGRFLAKQCPFVINY